MTIHTTETQTVESEIIESKTTESVESKTTESKLVKETQTRRPFDPEKDIITYDPKDCVELIQYMGCDATVVNSARVSFNKRIDDSLPISKGDKGLIKFLAVHNHFTPFTHCMITFKFHMPMYIRAQWYRHTVGFSRNEVSRRYVTDQPTFHLPEMLREKHLQKKQGSKDTAIEDNDDGIEVMKRVIEMSARAYDELLKLQVAPEMARIILPQSTMTEFYETASLSAYVRLLKLRLHPHAQKEIQEYARVVHDHLERLYPESLAALMSVDNGIHPDESVFYVEIKPSDE